VEAWKATDFSQPGWTVQRGQAVWTANAGASQIAGELVVATKTDGTCWVQFTKPPFDLVLAQEQASGWRVSLRQGRQQQGGRGASPSEVIWFELARVVAGRPPPEIWKYARTATGEWSLRNANTGESLEGYFVP
jgi:hypothetical protein